MNRLGAEKLVTFKSMMDFGVGKFTLTNVYNKLGLNTRPQALYLKTKHVQAVKSRLGKKLIGKALKNRISEFEQFIQKNGTRYRH